MTTEDPRESAKATILSEYGYSPNYNVEELLAEVIDSADEQTPHDLFDTFVKVIVADRAQPAADLETLANAASEWARELTDDVIPNAHPDDTDRLEVERNEIQAALGRYLDQKEN